MNRGLLPRLLRPLRRSLSLAGLSLLGIVSAAQAQNPVLHGLGTITFNPAAPVTLTGFSAGDQFLLRINPVDGTAISPTGQQQEVKTQFGTISIPAPLKISYAVPPSATQTLVGFDYRPNTGQAYALGYDAANQNAATTNAQLYTLNTTTGLATPVGSAMFLELGSTNRIGFDFNPTVDRIRVVSMNDNNYRLNPSTGEIIKDGTITYPDRVPADPGIGSVAYTNSYIGATSSTLLGLDETDTAAQAGLLGQFSVPNLGTISNNPAPVQSLLNGNRPDGTVSFADQPIRETRALDFDIYFDPSTRLNKGYLLEVTNMGASNIYAYNLTSGRADRIGNTLPKGLPLEIRDIAAQTDAPTAPAQQGQLLYALAAGNLIEFDSQNPNNIRRAVNFGAGIMAGQTVVGFDFRPASAVPAAGTGAVTPVLYALGYNPDPAVSTNNASLYTVDLTTGLSTPVGAGPFTLNLGNTTVDIGFDFNPTVDLIRVTSAANRANYRLNPVTGAPVSTDGTLTNDISGVAYTNNDNNANTGTALYGYDQTNNFLVLATPLDGLPAGTNAANAGTYRNVGTTGSGITVNPGVDFDIFTDNAATPATNTAFLVASTLGSATDNLYAVNLVSGSVAPIGENGGRIGLGGNYTALAALPTASPVVNLLSLTLTWNGSVSPTWSDANNWTPARVPTSADDVIIPGENTPNEPIVSGTQQARSVTLTTGAVLTTANGGRLQVAGNFINNGGTVEGAGTGQIELTGTSSAVKTIGGTTATNFFNLTISSTGGAALSATTGVRRLLSLTTNLTTNDRTLTLLSTNGSEQGQVFNNGGAVVGAVTVQRSIDGGLNAQNIGYRHYATPVNNSDIKDLNSTSGSGFTAVLNTNTNYNTAAVPRAERPFPNVLAYNQDRVTGEAAAQTGFESEFDKGFFVPTSLEIGRGYSVNIADDVTVDFVGTLNNGPYSRTGLRRTGSFADNGFHFLGNPYPSALDWTKVGRSQVEPALFVFKSTGQYAGYYTGFNNGKSVSDGTDPSRIGNGILPVGQGFFVRAIEGATNGSVTFTNAARLTTYDATPFQRGAADQRPTLTLALRTAAGRGEQTMIYFEPGATADYDAAYDATHLNGPGAALSLATQGNLSINGRAALSGTDVLVALELRAAAAGPYVLSADELTNLPAGYHAYLRDAVTGTYTDLAAQPRLTLALTGAAADAGRFAVLFSRQSQVLASAPAALAQLATVFPNPARGTASLLLPAALRGGKAIPVQVLNSLGQVVLSRTLPAQGAPVLELPLTGLTPGIYLVRAQTAAGQVVKRLTVQ